MPVCDALFCDILHFLPTHHYVVKDNSKCNKESSLFTT